MAMDVQYLPSTSLIPALTTTYNKNDNGTQQGIDDVSLSDMSYPEQNTEYPLANMPRLGRRNAIAYPNRILHDDDDGAFSPINLLHRASLSDIDPDGFIVRELKLQRRSKTRSEQKSKVAIPSGSVYDGWNRLRDARTEVINEIEQLLEPNGTLEASLSVVESKPKRLLSSERLRGNNEQSTIISENHRGNPVIPWRKQGVKQSTLADERRKMFESFDMTSFEPPDTPQVSESTLRKFAKKSKKRSGKTFDSQSMASTSPGKLKDYKDPYINVQPKVITKWEKIDEHQQRTLVTNESDPTDKDNDKKLRRLVTDAEKLSQRARHAHIRPFPAFPVKRQISHTDNKSKYVINYPAAVEAIKNPTSQLPLTIAPRYNHRKALGLPNNAKTVAEPSVDGISETALYGVIPAHQKGKHESQVSSKAPTGNSVKSMFLNLHRINNGGATSYSTNRRSSSTDQLHIGRYSANVLGTPVIGGVKKPTPLTTIQAPPSPFLLSKISIQSQIAEIPINGERIKAGTSKGSKKVAKITPHKTNVNSKNIPSAAETAKASSPVAPKVTLQPAKPIQTPTKVIPSLGPVPNKYNNIYIGPYSGSDSDGEHHSSSRR